MVRAGDLGLERLGARRTLRSFRRRSAMGGSPNAVARGMRGKRMRLHRRELLCPAAVGVRGVGVATSLARSKRLRKALDGVKARRGRPRPAEFVPSAILLPAAAARHVERL